MAKHEDTKSPDTAAGHRESPKEAKEKNKPHDPQSKQTSLSWSPEASIVPYRHGNTPARQGSWGPLTRLRDEFDRMFDQFSRGWLGMPAGHEGNWGLDVREDDDSVSVRAEAPGFEPADFKIQV